MNEQQDENGEVIREVRALLEEAMGQIHDIANRADTGVETILKALGELSVSTDKLGQIVREKGNLLPLLREIVGRLHAIGNRLDCGVETINEALGELGVSTDKFGQIIRGMGKDPDERSTETASKNVVLYISREPLSEKTLARLGNEFIWKCAAPDEAIPFINNLVFSAVVSTSATALEYVNKKSPQTRRIYMTERQPMDRPPPFMKFVDITIPMHPTIAELQDAVKNEDVDE